MGLMDLINQASGIIGKAAPIIAAGTGIAGTIGNIQASRTRNQAVQQSMAMTEDQRAMQRYYQDLAAKAQAPATMSPQDIATAIAQMQRPLGAGLTSGVSNLVQANMAERGLAQSPAIFSSVMAQALAPYMMQQQQLAASTFQSERDRATQQYMQTLGLPITARAQMPNYTPYPEPVSNAGSWSALINLLSKRQPGTGLPGMGGRTTFPMPIPRSPTPLPPPNYPGGSSPRFPAATPPYAAGSEPGASSGGDIDWASLIDKFQQAGN